MVSLLSTVSAELLKTQKSSPQKEAPERFIEDGMKMILGAVRFILRSITKYKKPEVLCDRDIIIRRVQPSRGLPN